MVGTRNEAVVADSIATWASPLEDVLLGTDDPTGIVALLEDFCLSGLGIALDTVAFYRRGVGAVFGAVLRDGRRVVVKVHRREMVPDGLEGIREVQRRVADMGLPAPRPLGDPLPMGKGLAAAEEMLNRGNPRDAHDPALRRVLVAGLRRFVEATEPMLGSVRLALAHPLDLDAERLWPPGHDLRFDLALAGGEWIDEVGAAARAILNKSGGPMVVGHMDWRPENLRFDEHGIAAIFDWDSVKLCAEPALVGSNATGFTANWESGVDPYPSPEESDSFVADYESARGAPFTTGEKRIVDAARLYRLAYSARCEHSDVTLGILPELPGRGWRFLLRANMERRSDDSKVEALGLIGPGPVPDARPLRTRR